MQGARVVPGDSVNIVDFATQVHLHEHLPQATQCQSVPLLIGPLPCSTSAERGVYRADYLRGRTTAPVYRLLVVLHSVWECTGMVPARRWGYGADESNVPTVPHPPIVCELLACRCDRGLLVLRFMSACSIDRGGWGWYNQGIPLD